MTYKLDPFVKQSLKYKIRDPWMNKENIRLSTFVLKTSNGTVLSTTSQSHLFVSDFGLPSGKTGTKQIKSATF